MIILFSSFARGDWVDDIYTEGHITYEYKILEGVAAPQPYLLE